MTGSRHPAEGRLCAAVLLAATLLPWAGAHAETVVTLRGGKGSVRGDVMSMTGSGLAIRSGGNVTNIMWGRVATVTGDAEAEFAAGYAKLADGLWRIEARAARGDYDGAEVLYEKLDAAGVLKAATGPSQRRLQETLTGLRLARGFVTGGMKNYLQAIAATATLTATGEDAGAGEGGAVSMGSAVIDPATGLCPSLPPVLNPGLSGGAAAALARWPGWDELIALPGTAGEVARWYQAEALVAAGQRPAMLDLAVVAPAPGEGAGATGGPEVLVRNMVVAAHGNAEQRKAARNWLQRKLSAELSRSKAAATASPPGGTGASGTGAGNSAAGGAGTADDAAADRGWIEAWCRLGIGRSYLRETEAGDRRKGLLELMYLPAVYSERLPLPTAMGLVEAAAELDKLGDGESARTLRADVQKLIPGAALEATPASGDAGTGGGGGGTGTPYSSGGGAMPLVPEQEKRK